MKVAYFLNDKGSTAFLKDETVTAFSKPVRSYKLRTTIEEFLFALNTQDNGALLNYCFNKFCNSKKHYKKLMAEKIYTKRLS